MLTWFVGTAVVAVLFVFRDPAFDYRALIVGAVLPDLVDSVVGSVAGGVLVLHSVLTCVAVLAAVMAVTVGRRALRKALLGLPIGMFLHLVFDAAFDDARVFWWPLGGLSVGDARLPLMERGWWNVPLELAGVALVVWLWRRHGLADPGRRRWFLQTGQLVDEASPTAAPPTC